MVRSSLTLGIVGVLMAASPVVAQLPSKPSADTYDQAVERAIRRCDPFPRPREGAMPRSLRLTFDPVDTR